MTKVRATVVCEESLYTIAKNLHFDIFLIVGKGEQTEEGVKNKAR